MRAACFVLFDAGSHFVVNGKGIGVPTFSSKVGEKGPKSFSFNFSLDKFLHFPPPKILAFNKKG